MTGISGLKFLLLSLLLLAGLFAIGAAFAPDGHQINLIAVTRFAFNVLWRLALIAVAFLFLAVVVFTQVLDTKISGILPSLDQPDNLSYGFIAGGLLGVVTIAVATASAVSLPGYLYELLTKGSVGLMLGLFTAVITAVLIKIRSMDSFKEYVTSPRNNQKVIFLMAAMNMAMYVAMTYGR